MLFLPQRTKKVLFHVINKIHRSIRQKLPVMWMEFMPHYSMRFIFELVIRETHHLMRWGLFNFYSICSILAALNHFHADSVSPTQIQILR